jgi:D-xylose reductase
VSKLWNTNHAAKHVEPACRKSLADWALDYFDLYLIHMPIPLAYVDPKVREHPGWTSTGDDSGEIQTERSPIHLTWGAMEGCHTKGLARNIGVSNFCSALIVDLMCYANVHPQVLQIEMHPYFVQQGMIDVCKAYGIHLMAYSSFGPASWVELNHPATKTLPSLLTLDTITAIAAQHAATPAQVLLRWATQRGITVIPKSSNPTRLRENLENTGVTLSEAEIASISALDKKFRIAAGGDPRINIWA